MKDWTDKKEAGVEQLKKGVPVMTVSTNLNVPYSTVYKWNKDLPKQLSPMEMILREGIANGLKVSEICERNDLDYSEACQLVNKMGTLAPMEIIADDGSVLGVIEEPVEIKEDIEKLRAESLRFERLSFEQGRQLESAHAIINSLNDELKYQVEESEKTIAVLKRKLAEGNPVSTLRQEVFDMKYQRALRELDVLKEAFSAQEALLERILRGEEK